jgi:peptidoglycan/xylan/chitin deacetylase (PgdA/CDA1 family)
MYHYVRELEHSRYPDIKGLPVDEFQAQIEYVRKHYNVITAEQFIEAVDDGEELPPQAALLTFDDGYQDHFDYVFPILDEAGLSGCFFPPAKCVLERKVLDVNKIHYLLASTEDVDSIVDRIFDLMEAWEDSFALQSPDAYWEAASGDHRFDPQSVIFVKRMLQRELPNPLRRRILDRLFDTFVDVPEATLAQELYMSLNQLRCLHRHGMYIGSHGYRHEWMDRLDPDVQREEVDKSLIFLEQVGTPTDRWIMCYPYGAHDQSLRAYLHKRGCAVGLTTDPDLADLEHTDPLALPRLDTNDLPKATSANPNSWTMQALSD